ncbi:MAG: ATP-binding protein [Rhodoferax sp.]
MTTPSTAEGACGPAQAMSLLMQASGEILLLLQAGSLRICACNEAATRLLGYSAEQLVGSTIGDHECALSDLFFWDEMHAQSCAEDVESALRCANGEVLQVSKTVRQTGTEPAHYTYRAVPMSQHNRIATELANTGSQLRATLEATAEGILLLDHSGGIININQQFSDMWQLPATLLEQHDEHGILAHLHALCERGEPVASESALLELDAHGGVGQETVYLRDGRVIECAVRPAHVGQERLGHVYSYRDVTERHRTQQELIAARDEAKRASAAKTEFLAVMSHEIRTPMNGVLGVADLLSRTTLDATQAEYVRVIQSSGETLLALLNDILDFSKIEAGKLKLEHTRFSLPTLINDVVALFRQLEHEGGPILLVHAQPGLAPDLVGDPVRLRQILLNLVSNAFKFTERGNITMRVQPLSEQGADVVLRFSVQDTGIGMAPDTVERLFQSFEQADRSTTRKYGGTGLGLVICKRLTNMMGGDIGVQSALGQGSEFWFTVRLQRAQDHATQVVSAAAPLPAPSRLNPQLRVLLVEDHPVNRLVVINMLKRLGLGVPTVAENGLQALERAQEQAFDLVLMDIQMPVMDGLQATRELRLRGFAAPIIGLSAGALEEERQAALDAGADNYVLKPIQMDALRGALERALPDSPESAPAPVAGGPTSAAPAPDAPAPR